MHALLIYDAVFVAILVVLAITAPFTIRRFRGWHGEHKVRQAIRRSGLRAIHDYYCRDATGIPTQIDHLIHADSTIAVVETKNIAGRIYGTAGDSHWTRGWGKHKLRFQNPLHQNHRHLMTLRERFPDAEFEPIVVFTSGRFPKGIPTGVATLDTLATTLTYIDREPHAEPTPTDAAWTQIEAERSTQTSLDVREHRASLKRRFSG